ncbi:MAG: glycoside hydrolase N-terminal domain-containing protein [Planctomycetota bacterium]
MDSEQPREKIMQKTTYPATRRSIVVTLCLSVLCLAVSGCMSNSAARSRLDDEDWADMLLWYRQPATEWTEALPVGNGRLGAMIFAPSRRASLTNTTTPERSSIYRPSAICSSRASRDRPTGSPPST